MIFFLARSKVDSLKETKGDRPLSVFWTALFHSYGPLNFVPFRSSAFSRSDNLVNSHGPSTSKKPSALYLTFFELNICVDLSGCCSNYLRRLYCIGKTMHSQFRKSLYKNGLGFKNEYMRTTSYLSSCRSIKLRNVPACIS